MEVFLTDAGNGKMKLQLRALSDSPADSNKLTKMIELATIDPGTANSALGCRLSLCACAREQNICFSCSELHVQLCCLPCS